MEHPNSKKLYPSPQQKQMLIQLIEADPQLRSGKFSSSFTKKDSERRWKEIEFTLNALNGAKKSWEGWRKDRKSNIKKKFALDRRQASMTGGGPPPKPPTDEDLLVLSTMPTTSLVGHTDCQESLVQLIDINNFPNMEITTSGTAASVAEVASVSTEVLIEEIPVEIESQPIDEVQSTEQPFEGTQRRPMTKRQTMTRSLRAAENLNRTLEIKNAYKKVFYEQFIQLMQQQTNALITIANSLSARNSPYI